jgi:hypothetical protein
MNGDTVTNLDSVPEILRARRGAIGLPAQNVNIVGIRKMGTEILE